MATNPVPPINGGNATPVRIVPNRFHGPLSALYEGPMNDIRHKLVEEGWYGRQVTGDFKEPEVAAGPEEAAKPEPGIHGTGPTVIDAQFKEVYGESLNPVEAPEIKAPEIEPPSNDGPRIDP